jgi:predicted  nucleic acid-binding Zn-ribbon protein
VSAEHKVARLEADLHAARERISALENELLAAKDALKKSEAKLWNTRVLLLNRVSR